MSVPFIDFVSVPSFDAEAPVNVGDTVTGNDSDGETENDPVG